MYTDTRSDTDLHTHAAKHKTSSAYGNMDENAHSVGCKSTYIPSQTQHLFRLRHGQTQSAEGLTTRLVSSVHTVGKAQMGN